MGAPSLKGVWSIFNRAQFSANKEHADQKPAHNPLLLCLAWDLWLGRASDRQQLAFLKLADLFKTDRYM